MKLLKLTIKNFRGLKGEDKQIEDENATFEEL